MRFLSNKNKNNTRRPQMTFVAITSSALIAGLALLGAGCGGGGGSDEPVPVGAANRSAAITAVRGVRGAAVQIASAGSLAGGLGGAADAGLTTRHASDTPHDEPELFPVEFDEAYGLYSQFATTSEENKFRINYFKDQQGRENAGHFELELIGSTETYPFTVKLAFDLTAGNEPGSGNFEIVAQSATRARVTGTSTDRLTGDKTTFDVTVDGERVTNSRLSLDPAGDGDNLTIENLNVAADGTVTADVVSGDQRGTVRAADGSGELALGEGSGRVVCAWDAAGRGTVRDVAGAVVNIDDFDTVAAE